MINGELSKAEAERYQRQIALPGFGVEAQLALKKARVLVIGAGGLGSPSLQYLSAAGVGVLGIVDSDRVEISNLQRQVIYSSAKLGGLKVLEAAEYIQNFNPLVKVETYPFRITAENAEELIKQYDLIVDGSDNFATRYLVNDACVVCAKPFVGASIFHYSGQLSVYNALIGDQERGPTYRCLFPQAPDSARVPNCALSGVIGAVAGVMGALQANEAIKILTGVGDPLIGKLMLFDALSLETSFVSFARNDFEVSKTKVLSAAEYECKCEDTEVSSVREITVEQLKCKLESNQPIFLLDVREQFEKDIADIGGQLIPLAELEHSFSSLPKDVEIIVYCRSGGRSYVAVELLQGLGFSKLANLAGGILAWSDHIDSKVRKY